MKTKTLEELIQLKQDGKIGWVEFLKESEYAGDYNQWLSEQGLETSEENAQQYLEVADNNFMDSQDNDYQYA